MKFKTICLTLVLGLSLSGCAASTSREDLRTCQDATYAFGIFAEYVGFRSGDTRDYPEAQRKLAKDLRDLSVRQVSSELSDGLLKDAEKHMRLSELWGLTYVNNFCEARFGRDFYFDW